jgi:hypothetical protein
VGDVPADPVAGDFNGDGRLDLAFNLLSNEIALLLGNGDGTFQEPRTFAVGEFFKPDKSFGVGSLIAGDFNRDGRLDLAVSNAGSNDVSVLLGNGDGTFGAQRRFAVGESPSRLATADFNGDGIPDLAVADILSRSLSVLLGNGDGTFGAERRLAAGLFPFLPIVGDFNGDGRIDLADSNPTSNDVSVLLGNGDGTFAAQRRTPVNLGPVAVVTTDFNGDGRADLARANPTSGDVTVSLGVGDGTFQEPLRVAVGTSPVALMTADFNRDGRPDLATVDYASNGVSVLLGLGDGRFQDALRFAVGTNPTFLVAGDFNGDGILDLATANAGSNDISLLLGNGDGTFQGQRRFAAGGLPQSLAAGDFNRDGRLDLAIADEASQDIRLLLGNGDGTFHAPLRLPLGTAPLALVTADFNGDGHLDLATSNVLSDDVSVLLGNGDGTFQAAQRWAVGMAPLGLLVADFNGDGLPDLATADNNSSDVALLLCRGDGMFAGATRLAVPNYPIALAAGDFNGDGRSDLAVATQLSSDLSLFEGLGDGTFGPPDTAATTIRSVPLMADLNGDAGVAVVNRDGQILFRRARPGAAGSFTPPQVVNPSPDPAARDLALVRTPAGLLLAALDARQSALSFYALRGGTFVRIPGPTVPGTLATRLVAGDLNGDGLDDLVVMAAGSSQVFVYLQSPSGGFGPAPAYQISVGLNPSDLALLDVDGDHRPDIVVTSQFSGTVSVVLNDPHSPFSSLLTFRGGSGLAGLDSVNGQLTMHSREAPLGLAVMDFNGDGASDLVVTHSGANTFSVLPASGHGGFLNPISALTFTTGSKPTVAVTGRFNADAYPDLAILNQDSGDLSIFLGDGHGGFTQRLRLNAGNQPTGLAVADVNGDGKLDLLVGNDFGDVLVLLGNGDGSFQPYQRTDGHMALAVADLNGDGTDDFVFANEAQDRVSVAYGQSSPRIVGDRRDGLLAPGAVRTADLNGDGLPDLVVANSGANSVLVYLGTGDGQFGLARSFFAGTDPVGITIADLNGDGSPDLVVANQGSNDVTVLLGQGQGTNWTLTNGPRLRLFDPVSGQSGIGPISTTVRDVTGDGIPDLLVSSPQSDNVFQINGIGRGLFNDQAPVVFDTPVGSAPVKAVVAPVDGSARLDLITIDSGTNSLTVFPGFGSSFTLGSGGERPVAAVAGDFNHDGLDDLIVANNEDGRIAVLLGSDSGLALAQVFHAEGVAHPTDLALSSDGEHLYVSGEGEEVVARFSLDFGTAVPVSVDQGALGAAEPVQRVAEVLPLRQSALPTVATFLTVSRAEGAVAGDSGGPEGSVSVLTGLVPVVVLPSVSPAGAPVGGTEDEPHEGAVGVPAQGMGATADNLVIGVDEALQRSAAGLRERIWQEGSPPAPGERPNNALEEVFRPWQPDLGAAGPHPQDSAGLVPAGAPGNALADLAVLPAGEQVAPLGHEQQPAEAPQPRPGENDPLGANVVLLAGFASILLPRAQKRQGPRGRPLSVPGSYARRTGPTTVA